MIKINKLPYLLMFLASSLFFSQQLFAANGYGIEKADDYSKLLDKPLKISQSAGIDSRGAAVLSSDYHMITNLPLTVLAENLINLDAAADIFNRITYSVDLTPENPLYYPHLQEIHTSYKFLGMGPKYFYQVDVVFDQVSDNEFAMRWQLTDSMGCGITELTGTWYLSTLTVDGLSMTYVRSYAYSVIENPPAGIIFFTNMFGEVEIRNTFKELIASVSKDL